MCLIVFQSNWSLTLFLVDFTYLNYNQVCPEKYGRSQEQIWVFLVFLSLMFEVGPQNFFLMQNL